MRLLLFNLATDADDPILGFTTHWINALAKRVERIYVITMRAGRIDVPDNVCVYSLGKEKGYGEPRRALEFYRHLLRILREDSIDVCFSHMIPIFTVLAAPVLKEKGVPIVTWYAHPSLTSILKLAHQLSDRMVTSLPTAYPYRKNKLMVVGQGIDTELFSSNGATPEQPPMILAVGRLSPVKDHQTLLQAVALLRAKSPKTFRVVIIGCPASPEDKTYVQTLCDQMQDLGLVDLVQFEQPIPRSALPLWYQRCTVHVNMTPTGSGDKVAWEAMSCGRPCILANRGFRDTLGIYADQLLFHYRDADDLADRLLRLLESSDQERSQMGRYLREQVVHLHSIDRLAQNLIAVLSSLIKSGQHC